MIRAPQNKIWTVVLLALVSAAAFAQSPPDGDLEGDACYFPTAAVDDGRFLSFGAANTATFGPAMPFRIIVPAGKTSFTLHIFDGDSSSPMGHWDQGEEELQYSLFYDPEGDGIADGLVHIWTGNSTNPLSNLPPGPLVWEASSETMPDNDWWNVTIQVEAPALSVSGDHRYLFVVKFAGTQAGISDFKLAITNAGFTTKAFGFEASLRSVANDPPIIFPGIELIPSEADRFLTIEPTYDGTWEIHFIVPQGSTEFAVFDGDFDHGSTEAVTIPSGLTFPPLNVGNGIICLDTDDFNTPDGYTGFPSDFPIDLSTLPLSEGAVGVGNPSDDANHDALRRGEVVETEALFFYNDTAAAAAAVLGRFGCVRYELISPSGETFDNIDPSGNLEWEIFSVGTSDSPNPLLLDYVVPGDLPFLEAGIWKLRIVGLDMINVSFLFSPNAACCVDAAGVPQCSVEINGSIGDTVFEDLDGDGKKQEAGEPGIEGVTVEIQDSGGIILETQVTDDSGNYLFQFLRAGDYSVLVDPTSSPLLDLNPTFDLDGIVTPHIVALLTLLPGESNLDVDFGYSRCDADDDSDSDSDSDSDKTSHSYSDSDTDSDKPRWRWRRRWRQRR